MRFLLSRRWILFFLAVVVLAYGCYLLGRWQFHRLAETKAQNRLISRNLHTTPTPAKKVLAVGQRARWRDEWKRVTATGTYDPSHKVVVRYQTRNSRSGVDVVTPLRTEQGPALLVDRGWVATGNTGGAKVNAPDPPSGRVTVVGWVRVNGTGDSTIVTAGSTRAISSTTIAPHLPYPVYGGFVDAHTETPKPAHPLAKIVLPDRGDGPHFFYGVQWWFFGVLAIFGFCYLAWDERRKLRRAEAAQAEKPGSPDERPVGAAPRA